MDEYLTLSEAIEKMKVSRATIYRMVEQDKLKIYKIAGGKKTFFKREELESLFAPGEYRPKKEPVAA